MERKGSLVLICIGSAEKWINTDICQVGVRSRIFLFSL